MLALQISLAKKADATEDPAHDQDQLHDAEAEIDRLARQIDVIEQAILDLKKSLAQMVDNPDKRIELFRRRRKRK